MRLPRYALEELNPNILIFGGTPGNGTPAGPTNSANLDRSNEFDPTVPPRFVTAQRGEVLAITGQDFPKAMEPVSQ
jgi:hypothetical protein